MHLAMALLTSWANAFEHKISTLHLVAFRQMNLRNGKVFKTNGLAAVLAVEVNMHVIVNRVVEAVAEFITHTFTVFKHMHKMLFLEESQSTEDA